MKTTLLALLLIVIAAATAAVQAQVVRVERPDTSRANDYYVGNKEPLLPSPLVKLPVGKIKAKGWLLRQLQREAEGFTGHLPELSEYLREEDNAWLSPTGEGRHGWEEVPYWLKGFGDLGYVLDDERIIKEARKWIEAALASQREDGWFGPRSNLVNASHGSKQVPDLWPNMVMLNALQSYCEYSGDKRVLDLMTKYFRWELNLPEEDFLPPFWQQQRAGDNMRSVYWLYNLTGEKWLLDLAAKIQRRMAPWSKEVASWHGVNICQCFRSPATFYMQSRDPAHLQATEARYQDVIGLYGQVPGGMFGADENCRQGYDDPRQGGESCSIAEMMLSDEILLGITGDLKWADRCEEVAFNSWPACMTADLKALRYLTAPNQVLSDAKNKAPGVQNGGPMFLFDPHQHRCCQHNIAHGWPKFTEHLWWATPGGGLAAVLYAPAKVTAKVGDGTEVTITETTRYPFDEAITLTLSTPKPVRFPLYLRLPAWCDAGALAINGKDTDFAAGKGRYLQIEREWADGNTLLLKLPMKISLTTWAKNHNSVSVNRGPLTYSLKIGEKYVRNGGTDKWPALEVYPTTPWNYGLALDENDPAGSFEVVERPWPQDNQPFAAEAAPIELRAPAKKIPGWQLDQLGLVGLLQQSPARSDEPTEAVTLIPMGAARLRVSAFPTIGTGAGAHQWTPPPKKSP